MKKIDFCEVLGDINEKYVKMAHAPNTKKRPAWIKWGAMAACLAAVAITAVSVLPNYLNRPDTTSSDNPNGRITVRPSDNIPPAASELHISMKNIVLNEIAEYTDTARKWYNPDLYDYITWDKDVITDYYGKDLTPAYIPDGLIAAPSNGTATVITDKRGNIIEDTIGLGFYHAYYEDGSPKLTEDIAAVKGFSIIISKIGLLNDCIYLLPKNEVKTSDIDGTAVTFGYRSMPYGPYDPDTHKPSGYYDMYTAEFTCDEIEYQIVAEQMDIEEVIKVVISACSPAQGEGDSPNE